MATSSDAPINSTVGRYQGVDMKWQESSNPATATISFTLFRAIFDAVGDETIDTTGDIDPGVMLGIVRLGGRDAEGTSAWLRLVCQWARRRNMRVGLTDERPALLVRVGSRPRGRRVSHVVWAMHESVDELVGLTNTEAAVRAEALGLEFRDITDGTYRANADNGRVNVWCENGVVTRAEIF